ncbi:uncharacterized protein DUF3822 [Lutibacter sp. Hel_I_33_5]|uniref:DUF3822 family protein n=1 Tax=Lutibacter sp. Hel_I_33_5 TaxID=1566289 RepID=UPI0011ABA64B|nr:DUF3822 family protein [Lutibacter sp. Hel_I_33_5]TVZ57245.1 uncharacterized protein DUF3822 [Lutibacter sp. Hel_I_33_5]
MQKKTNSIETTNKNIVSIQFSLDGFSFCVKNSATKETLHFESFSFDKTIATPNILLDKLAATFKENNILQQDFATITAIHTNNLFSLVPNEYFDENNLKEYLQHNIKILANDLLVFDDLKEIEAKNVYVPYVNINNFIFQNFGTFEFKHHLSVLIDKLISNNKSEEKVMYVNVHPKNLDIVVIENNKLILANCFSFETKEDFIYYILFVAEQLKLDTDTIQLILLGDIDTESEIYNSTYDYIRKVDFIENTNSIFDTIPHSNHNNYILLS